MKREQGLVGAPGRLTRAARSASDGEAWWLYSLKQGDGRGG